MKKSRREINFDLYSKNCPKDAYKQLREFFESNGFKHRLFSGYISEKKLTDLDVAILNKKLWATFPWLEGNVRRLDSTIVEGKFDLLDIHNKQKEKSMEKENDLELNKNLLSSNKEDKKTMTSEEMKNFVKDIKNNKHENINKNEKSISKKNERDR